MKRSIVLLMLINIFSFDAMAQKDSSGIYKNADDFVAKRLSFGINCKKERHKIYLNDFFNKPYMTVKHNDSSYKVYRKDIYGYQFCNGETYRIVNRNDLQVLNPNEYIIIYRRSITHPPTGKTNVTNYYFSKGPYSDVQQLTFKNIRKAFAENKIFSRQVDSIFKYNTELATYDNQRKTFMINWIYKQSLK